MVRSRSLTGVLLVLAVLIAPRVLASEHPSAVRTMMVESGMVEQFGAIGDKFRNGVLQSGQSQGQLPNEYVQPLAEIVGNAMDGDELLDRIEGALEDGLSPEQVQAFLSFYRSPLGSRVRQAELDASEQAKHADLNAMAPGIQAELDKEPDRLKLYRELDDAVYATELSAAMLGGMMRAMFVGMLEAQPNLSPEQRGAALENFSRQSDGLVAKFQDRVIIGLARTYRGVSLADFREYVGFMRTEAARAVYAGVLAEFNAFLEEGGRKVGSDFSALLRQKKT